MKMIHPAAALLPLMPDAELDELAKDIKTHGLRKPIVLFEGLILDGRNRHEACVRAGVPPRFEEWDGDDPFEYVWSLNVHRRHLAAGQRAALRVKFLRESEEWAKTKRDALDRKRAGRPGGNVATRSREKVAKDASVSPRTAQNALTIEKKDPALLDKVAAGEVPLSTAAKAAKSAAAPEAKQEWAVLEQSVGEVVKRIVSAQAALADGMRKLLDHEAKQLAAGRKLNLAQSLARTLDAHQEQRGTKAAPDLRWESRALADIADRLRAMLPNEVCGNCDGRRLCPGDTCEMRVKEKCPCGPSGAPVPCSRCGGRGYFTRGDLESDKGRRAARA